MSASKNKNEDLNTLLTEDWLRQVGFKWHQLERQPTKQWLLWLGDANPQPLNSFQDFGIEVASGAYNENTGQDDLWNCWLRSDIAHRYSRFIHIRAIGTRGELIPMIEGLTGQEWNPANNRHGSMCTPEQAERIRREEQRLDLQLLCNRPPWYESEKDASRGRLLREHLDWSGYAMPILVAPTLEQARQLAAIVAGRELKIIEVLQ